MASYVSFGFWFECGFGLKAKLASHVNWIAFWLFLQARRQCQSSSSFYATFSDLSTITERTWPGTRSVLSGILLFLAQCHMVR